MKYLYYGGVILVASLILVLMPHNVIDTAEASTTGPTIWEFSPSTVTSLEFSGAHIEIRGANWPNEMHGLSAHLVNDDEWLQLETISYVPDAGKMLVMIPVHSLTTDDNTYDLIVMKPSGVRTVLKDAFTISSPVVEEEEVIEEEVDEEEEETTVSERPSVEVFKANGRGPSIIGYYPDEISGNPYGGSTLTILGHSWPNEMYGLSVQVRNAATDDVWNCTVISYSPVAGRMLVQTPSISVDKDSPLDVYISDNHGGRTVIKDALWYLAS